MLEIKNLNKAYGKTQVLKDVNITIEDNKIYGLLGRNGVGKTTLLNIISSQILRHSGEVLLDNEDVFENAKAMEQICFVKDRGIAFEENKIKELFKMAKFIYKDWDDEYKNYLVKEFNLNTNKKYEKLSRGYQTIVGLIIGLASRSRITIFDEPSLGLDAAFRYKFYNLLLEDYEKNPRTIIISTHLIDEVNNLFEEIIILSEGKVMLKEETDFLMESAYFLSGKEENLLEIINTKKIISREEFGTTVILGIFDNLSEDEIQDLKNKGIEISQIPLQKLFVYLTEQNVLKEENI
ncbi:ATP-binding cassette domain-containing protein [Anaerosalibacter sp. Marseille-P3206]|uniref:ATP-binding cassette domain-containing protein n=1 Tax=Anaerosalibacter sp. Marseille-P3206 TaxID=1871005 RepID=UPI0013566282|nr:ABC transporter ATP-binding protein [Anaerosalibacter sp. Marseille-P3206]